jgi:hypothetical protein
LDRLPELEARKKPDEVDKARCSRTDPDATVMKMADGGFGPASNVQFATDVDSQVIVGFEVITSGSDAGPMAVMVEPIRHRAGEVPGAMLVDGGFAQHEEIDAVSDPKVGGTVYAPVPKPGDSEAGWRGGGRGWRRTRPRRSTRAVRRRRNASTRWPGAEG